jgi:hypothetical protein
MIDNALSFIKRFLSEELKLRLGITSDIKIDTVDKDVSPDNVVITLINIEEEKINKNQVHYKKDSIDSPTYKIVNPEINLNLYILISAQKNDYAEALKQISYIITIFQGKNVFEKEDFPSDIPDLESLFVELYPLSFEQVSTLWQTLGSKLVPSVLYKVKLVSIQDNRTIGETGDVRGIGFDILRKS